MPKAPAGFTVTDVRVKLDNLIEFAQRRVDQTHADLIAAKAPVHVDALMAKLEHQLGRAHGLKEARELLELLEVEA